MLALQKQQRVEVVTPLRNPLQRISRSCSHALRGGFCKRQLVKIYRL